MYVGLGQAQHINDFFTVSYIVFRIFECELKALHLLVAFPLISRIKFVAVPLLLSCNKGINMQIMIKKIYKAVDFKSENKTTVLLIFHIFSINQQKINDFKATFFCVSATQNTPYEYYSIFNGCITLLLCLQLENMSVECLTKNLICYSHNLLNVMILTVRNETLKNSFIFLVTN